MTDFCPETGPSGALCGVAYEIVHSVHFNRAGQTWTTDHQHRPDTGPSAPDWLYDRTLVQSAFPDRQAFKRLLSEYEIMLDRQRWNPPQVLVRAAFGDAMMLRPCTCCHCPEGTVCFHGEQGGCFWNGPGR